MTGFNTAIFSYDGTYRYRLTRIFRPPDPAYPELPQRRVNFLMLNPSTATAETDDPTIRRCIGFAKSWGFDELLITNLFAYRSTDPKALKSAEDPVGPDNDRYIVATAKECERVVFAWGAHPVAHTRAYNVLYTLFPEHFGAFNQMWWSLGLTKTGSPRHPLYVPKATKPKRFKL